MLPFLDLSEFSVKGHLCGCPDDIDLLIGHLLLSELIAETHWEPAE